MVDEARLAVQSADHRLAEERRELEQLRATTERHSSMLDALRTDAADAKKELAFRALQQQQTDAARSAERRDLTRALEECKATTSELAQQHAGKY